MKGVITKLPLLKITLFSLLFFFFSITSDSLSLSTNSRWIVSPSGERFKLRCGNWAGHLNVMIPEGLDKQPVNKIAEEISTMGFNCVRLTWAIYMYTKKNNTHLTVERSLDLWNLADAKNGIRMNNPAFLGMTIHDAQKAVIDALGKHNVVVVLDNHVSYPMWCCNLYDGNGFFGDKYFDPDEWLEGLSIVANRYRGNPTVVGMSMRNELRGPLQNPEQWFYYMQQGAEAIHKGNPDLLVFVSGLSFDKDLTFLKQRPFHVTMKNKLVFESHWYAFGDPPDMWKYRTNEMCRNVTENFFGQSGFLLNKGDSNSKLFPLFLSEFGLNLVNGDEMEEAYLSCLLATVAGMDIDWALWALQGSYMLRDTKSEMDEYYGILRYDWGSVRNETVLQKLQFIQEIIQDPSINEPSNYIMYHPQTGNCLQVDGQDNIYASDCRAWPGRWYYNGNGGPIRLAHSPRCRSHSPRCLAATGDGLPAILSDECSGEKNTWSIISASKLHLATKDEEGNLLCLDWDFPNSTTIVTKKCLCLDEDSKDSPKCEDNPQRQWFKLVLSNKGM